MKLKKSRRDTVSNIISDDFSTLLEGNEEEKSACELTFQIKPTRTPSLISIVVTDCHKLEVFSGPYNEYLETIESEFVDEIEEAKIYRFDIFIDQPITSITLKFFTPKLELWIYGIQILLKKNANYLTNFLNLAGLGGGGGGGIPGLSASSSINFQNVDQMLSASNTSLSENAEKCKQFVESYSKMAHVLPSLNGTNDIMNFSKLTLDDIPEDEKQDLNRDERNCEERKERVMSTGPLENGRELLLLKMYIDEKFKKMEDKFCKKLNEMEERQNVKLDKILFMLENVNK